MLDSSNISFLSLCLIAVESIAADGLELNFGQDDSARLV